MLGRRRQQWRRLEQGAAGSRINSSSSSSSYSNGSRVELGMLKLLLLLLIVAVAATELPPGTECIPILTELEPCLPYVQQEHSNETPTNDCCSVLQDVHLKSAKCLCRLLHAEQNQPPTPGINLTLALLLPAACHLHVNPNRCPALLGESSVPPSASVGASSDDNSTPSSSSSMWMSSTTTICCCFLIIWLATTVLLQ